MNMEFYRNFIAMVEAGGMNKASRDIHVAQPALTRQLKIMEKEYGAPLVKPRRGRHRLELTEAGWIFYRQAKQICEVDDNTRSEIETLTEGLKGTLRISLSPSLSPQLIENVIRPFHEAYPDLTFRLRESYHMPLIDEVRRGISEIGIANAPLPDPSLFHILSQRSASLAVLGPAGDPFLGEQETLNLSALAGHPPGGEPEHRRNPETPLPGGWGKAHHSGFRGCPVFGAPFCRGGSGLCGGHVE